eukprot:3577859-Rhodomonas_salina.1
MPARKVPARYPPTPVLRDVRYRHIVSPYAMCGTDILSSYAMRGTDIACGATQAKSRGTRR